MPIQPGDRLPDVPVRVMQDGKPAVVSSADLLGTGRVVLFAVPGAFTPGCSKVHLPGYAAKAQELAAKGVDTIACVSVNDMFVMKAWAKDQGITDEVLMLADGNCAYTKALGLELDASGFGMGTRGQRFAIVVDNGVVSKLFVEAPMEFKVSAAEHVLANL